MFKWLVNNMRRGFATNSSSSHSLVYFKNPIASENTSAPGWAEYGWDTFVLDSTGEKLMYALVGLVGEHGYWAADGSDKTEEKVDEYYAKYGHLFPEFGKEEFTIAFNGYIDHQSVPTVTPKFLELARDPHVIIYGGNDNDGDNVTDHIHSAGDAALWGAGTDRIDDQTSAEELEAEWLESQKWRAKYGW